MQHNAIFTTRVSKYGHAPLPQVSRRRRALRRRDDGTQTALFYTALLLSSLCRFCSFSAFPTVFIFHHLITAITPLQSGHVQLFMLNNPSSELSKRLSQQSLCMSFPNKILNTDIVLQWQHKSATPTIPVLLCMNQNNSLKQFSLEDIETFSRSSTDPHECANNRRRPKYELPAHSSCEINWQ